MQTGGLLKIIYTKRKRDSKLFIGGGSDRRSAGQAVPEKVGGWGYFVLLNNGSVLRAVIGCANHRV